MRRKPGLSLILPTLLVAAWAGGAQALEFPLTRGQRAQKLVEEGQEQILRGDYFRAIDSCTRALSIRTDWAPAYLCRGEAKLRMKDADADKDAKQALTLDPKSGEPYRLLGLLEFEAGHYPAAIEQFGEALQHAKLKPDTVPDVYYYRAKSRLNLGDAKEALSDVGQGLGILQGINGDFADWSFYELRADIYRHLGEEKKAEEEQRRVIGLINQRLHRRPFEAPELLRRRAEANALLRDYDQALKDYDQALKTSTGDVSALLLDRADVFSKAGKIQEAISDLTRVLKTNPMNPEALRLRATERYSLSDYPGTISDLDAYLILRPEDAQAFADRGASKRFAGDFQGALADLTRAQTLDASLAPSIWSQKAYVLEMLGEHKSAMEAAQKALADDPENYSAHFALAEAGWSLGKCTEALPSLDWLTKKSSPSAQLRSMRGECRCALGRYPEGLSDLQQAATQEPQSRYMAVTLALHHRIYLSRYPEKSDRAELDKSIQYFRKAQAMGPLDTDERLGLVLTYYELSKKLTAPKDAPERSLLLQKAGSQCKAVLKKAGRNQSAIKLCKAVRDEATVASKKIKK